MKETNLREETKTGVSAGAPAVRAPAGGSSAAPAKEERQPLLPTPSTPKGGGAIRGIGEKLTANPATGTASFEVPIAVSAGRGGGKPALSLSYDSGGGNGPFGLGWQLSVPSITRKTDRGLPRYDDREDTFILAGSEDLVPFPGVLPTVRGEYTVFTYRPRTEGSFHRIERWVRDDGDAHWRVTTPENAVNVYGADPTNRIADPEAPELRVFSWLLEETRDDRGNVTRFEYAVEDERGIDRCKPSELCRFPAAGKFLPTAQRYLKRILYGNAVPDVAGGWLFEVVLDYGEHDLLSPEPDQDTKPGPDGEVRPWLVRADPFSTHRAGFDVRSYRLCRRILGFHRFPEELGEAPYLVRSTDFEYDETPTGSTLRSITQAGYTPGSGGYERVPMPPLELGYTEAVLDDRLQLLEPESLAGIPGGVDGAGSQWIDLDGEGLPGVVTATPGAWYYKANLGGGVLEKPELLDVLPAPADLGAGRQQLSDLAGEGRLSLVQYGTPLPGYFARSDEEGWEPFRAFPALPQIDWNDPDLRFVDLDGDGIADVLVAEDDVFVWFRSKGKEGFEPATLVTKATDEDQGPALVFADGTESIQLVDLNGDGLVDIVRVRNGEVSYWPNLGYGRFGAKITMDRSPIFDACDQFDPRRVRFADLDGTGPSDLVYSGHAGVFFWINQSGNGWGPRQQIRSLPPLDANTRIGLVDLMGTGTSCLVISSSMPGPATSRVAYVDLLGSRKAHLLSTVVNNLGAETRIAYAPSTKFYLEDKATHHPWLTKLPFPVHVVERVENLDHVTGTRLVTRYKYHHGYYDSYEREFRGFAFVEQWDAESFGGGDDLGADHALDQPPVLTRTWFHTGAWLGRDRLEDRLAAEYFSPGLVCSPLPPDLSIHEEREAARALRGRMLRQEIYAEDGSARSGVPYVVTERSYGVRLLQHAQPDGHAIFLPYDGETLTLHYERDPDDPRVLHEAVLVVDDFGNPVRRASIAYPRRANAQCEAQGRPLVTVTEKSFIHRPSETTWYRVNVPREESVWELTGVQTTPGQLLKPTDIDTFFGDEEPVGYDVPMKRLVSRTRHRYRWDDLSGALTDPSVGALAFGEIDSRALPYESYQLAFTQGLLDGVFETRIDPALVETEGRYVRIDDAWWVPSGRVIPAAERFYQPVAAFDPFGHELSIEYDSHSLLVVSATDQVGNVVTAENCYRVLAPKLVTDPNGNRTAVEFDALGMVVRTALMGKVDANEGDTLDDPTTELIYDLDAWREHGRPVSVETRAREQHGAANPRWQRSISYSDGHGQEVMKKIQAEPGFAPKRDAEGRLVRDLQGEIVHEHTTDRWVGTGRTVFNNKGKPVKQYEPFFSSTPDYEDEDDLVETGVTPILHYDPVGRLVRTENPDGTELRVVFDAWTQLDWDENDSLVRPEDLSYLEWDDRLADPPPENLTYLPWALRRLEPEYDGTPERRALELTLKHVWTPNYTWFDVLGRPVVTVENNGDAGQYATRITLDIVGNQLAVVDALGNSPAIQEFDLLKRPLRVNSCDAGDRRTFPDVAGKPIYTWDARGTVVHRRFDALERPTHLHVTAPGETEVLAERTFYGETHPDAVTLNLRGRPWLGFDGAGLVIQEVYDFKGNPVRTRRRLATEYQGTVDWSPVADEELDIDEVRKIADELLEKEEFESTATFDALGRIVTSTSPDGSVTRPTYNEANLLERLDVRLRGAAAWTTFVAGVDYNARGQRLQIEYGNGTVTEYTYDPDRFRLIYLKTIRISDQRTLQCLLYTYDPVGNITEVDDDAQPEAFFDGEVVSARGLYEYDALYRLTRATGREHPGQVPSHDDSPWAAVPHPKDLQALARYQETYDYDAVGNIARVGHDGGVSWTREYEYEGGSNRLLQTTDEKGNSQTYEHDADGNMIRMPHLETLSWDHAQRAQRIVKPGTAGTVHFAYDAAGTRVRKVFVDSAGNRNERIYLDGFEVFRRRVSGAVDFERQTLHVFDDKSRVALVETKTVEKGIPVAGAKPLARFQLPAYLPSVAVELDAFGQVISYEEYYPFGATSIHSQVSSKDFSQKRYRHLGNERDEETGLTHHGARLYAAWLGRWTSADPIGLQDGLNLFRYCQNRPVIIMDKTGLAGLETETHPDGLGEGRPAAEAPSDQHYTEAMQRVIEKTGDDRWFEGIEYLAANLGMEDTAELMRRAEELAASLPESSVSSTMPNREAVKLALAVSILIAEANETRLDVVGPDGHRLKLADVLKSEEFSVGWANSMFADRDYMPSVAMEDNRGVADGSLRPFVIMGTDGVPKDIALGFSDPGSNKVGITTAGLASMDKLVRTIMHEARHAAGERHPSGLQQFQTADRDLVGPESFTLTEYAINRLWEDKLINRAFNPKPR